MSYPKRVITKDIAPAYASLIEQGNIQDWRKLVDDRQQKEIEFSELYEEHFKHGTTGHNQLIVIALMARLLDFIARYYVLVPRSDVDKQ